MEFENAHDRGSRYSKEMLDLEGSIDLAIQAVIKKIDSGEISNVTQLFVSPSAVPSMSEIPSDALLLVHGGKIMKHFITTYPTSEGLIWSILRTRKILGLRTRERYPYWQNVVKSARWFSGNIFAHLSDSLLSAVNMNRSVPPEAKPQTEDTPKDLLDKAVMTFRNENNRKFALNDEEKAELLKIFSDYDRQLAQVDNNRGRTIGVEIELFNLQADTAEMRPSIFTLPHIDIFMAFHKAFSEFLRKKYKKEKILENEFVEYPYFNLHLNFGLKNREANIAKASFDILDAISYSYTLAYCPPERIAYLEYHGSGQTRTSSVDSDIICKQSEQIARFQTRYFTVGGNRVDSARALNGIVKTCSVINSLLKNAENLQKTQTFLETDRELHDALLELKWIVEHFFVINKLRFVPDSEERVHADDTYTQDYISLLGHYQKIQKHARALLSRHFGNIEYAIDE